MRSAIDGFDWLREELEGLVDEMGAQIVDAAAAQLMLFSVPSSD